MSDTKKLEINPVIYPSTELKMLLDEAIKENKTINTEVLPFPELPTDIGQTDLALALILDLKPSDKRVAIKEAWDKMWATIMLTIKSQIEAIENNVSAIFFNTLFKIVYELIDQIIGPYDKDIINIQITWNKVIRIYRELCDPYLGEKIKTALQKELFNIMDMLIREVPFVADIIALIMLFDTMKKTIKCLRDAKKASAEEYGDINKQISLNIEILNKEEYLKSQIITTIVYFLGLLLPLLSVLGSIYNTGRKFKGAYDEALESAAKEEDEKVDKIKEKFISEIKTLAENNQLGFSYSKENSKTSYNTNYGNLGERTDTNTNTNTNTGTNTGTNTSKPSKTIPIGAEYHKKVSLSDTIIWNSVGLDDISTPSKEYGEVECRTPYGTIYGIISNVNGSDVLTTIDKEPDYCHTDIDYTNMCNNTNGLPHEDADGVPFDLDRDQEPGDEDQNQGDGNKPGDGNQGTGGGGQEPGDDDQNQGNGNQGPTSGDSNNLLDDNQYTEDLTAANYAKDYGAIGAFIEYEKNSELSLLYKDGESLNKGNLIGSLSGQNIECPCDGINVRTDTNVSLVDFKDRTSISINNEFENLENQVKSLLDSEDEFTKLTKRFEKLSKIKIVIKDCILRCRLPHIPNNMTNSSKPKKTKQAIIKNYINYCDDYNEKFEEDTEKTTGKEHVEYLLNDGKMEQLKDEIMELNKKFFEGVFDIYDNYQSNLNMRCDQESLTSFSLIEDYMELYDSINYDEDNEYIVEFSDMISNFIRNRKANEAMSNEDKMKSLNDLCDEYIKSKWKFDDSYYDKFEKIYTTKNETGITSSEDNKDESEYKILLNFLINLMDCAEEEQQTTSFTSIDDISNLGSDTGYNMDKAKMRANMKKICRKFILVRNMGDSELDSKDTDKIRINRLKKQCAKEVEELDKFVNKVRKDYYDSISVLEPNVFDDFKKADVRKMQNVFYNGKEYEHYFVIPAGSDEEIDLGEYGEMLANFESSPKTKTPGYELPYWLIYCLQATLVHCMLPMYWACGMIIMGAPLLLPVIYIPIYALKGDVTIVFGLGICGMFIYPMILFVNFNLEKRTIIPFINSLVNMLRNLARNIEDLTKKSIKGYAHKKMEDALKSSISYQQELEDVDIEISNAKEFLVGCGKARKEVSKKRNK